MNEVSKARSIEDPEYNEIRYVSLSSFVEFTKDRDIKEIRLPVNNPEAYSYLRWCNAYFTEDSNFLNYLINLWSAEIFPHKVRPPTIREYAVICAKHITDLSNVCDEYKNMYIDVQCESIRDAYFFWCYPNWIKTGLAGAIIKFGTFEDNAKEGDEWVSYEHYDKYYDDKEKDDKEKEDAGQKKGS